MPAAFITSALIASSLQYAINNIRVARVQTLVSRQRALPQEPTPGPAPTSTESALSRLQTTLGRWSPVRKLSDEEYAEILHRQRKEVQDALAAWEKWMTRGTSGTEQATASGGLARPEINVEQATRELDSLERKIRTLEEKIRSEREDVQRG